MTWPKLHGACGAGVCTAKECAHDMFGYMCARPFDQQGRCIDDSTDTSQRCRYSRRLKGWDSKGRAEANS